MVGSLDNSAKQGIGYLLVGCGSALIELGLFQVLYGLIGLNVSIANIVAVVCATAFNFLTNQRVTFKSALNPVQSLARYLLLFAFNTTFTTCAITYLVSLGLNGLIAKFATMCCVVCWNFFLYKSFGVSAGNETRQTEITPSIRIAPSRISPISEKAHWSSLHINPQTSAAAPFAPGRPIHPTSLYRSSRLPSFTQIRRRGRISDTPRGATSLAKHEINLRTNKKQ